MTTSLYARGTIWKFKPGKRAEAVKLVEGFQDEIRKSKGFRGLMVLLSVDDPNEARFLALWDSEDSLKASEKGVYSKVSGKAMPLAERPPELKHFEIPSALLALI